MKIARWVDLGAPIDLTSLWGSNSFAGFLEDDIRPTLAMVPTVARAASDGQVSRFVIGAYDLDSGINPSTLQLTLNRAVGAAPAGTNLAAGLTIAEGGTLVINLAAPLDLASGDVTATLQIRDNAGHTTRIVRTYRAGAFCASLSSITQFFASGGGGSSVAITAAGSCGWSAVSNASWINITSAAAGAGNATITYTVAENLTGAARTGTMTIAGRAFTVVQDGGVSSDCSYSTPAKSKAFKAAGGTGSFTVSAQARCAWQAASNAGWITITSGTSGVGNGTVTFSVAPNTGGTRKGTITVAGRTYTVKQKGG
jgi:hypothetical protein